MYCPQCACEYSGWKEKCPVCKTTLLDGKPEVSNVESTPMDYADLVDAVRENGGALTIKMVATDIATKRGRQFPYIGRGYAWTKQMEGTCDDCTATLTTTDVGRDRKWTFPYFGYGFAWEKEMQGSVGGNPLTLEAEKVIRETRMGFPYAGYGRAWVQSMSGKCGEDLEATLTITEAQQRRKVSFPYFGFGYAWVNAGDLTLKLAE
jgi:hypothetical protein